MRHIVYFLVLSGALGLVSCGSSDSSSSDEGTEKSGNSFLEAAKQLREVTGSGEGKEAVNFRELKKGFPESVGKYDMQDFGGSTNSMLGYSFSQAEAKYVSGDHQINVNVIDAAGIGILITSMAAWSVNSIDREDSNGMARTGKIMGYPSFEEYDKNNNSSSIALIIEDRIIFSANANQMGLDDLKKFIERFDPGDFKKIVG